jgi:hydroxymethylpyrimidine/phosphomethylpyrimidine kinase
LSVAGSDSSGGAGIQADLRTFASMGVWGTCAITAVTAQNPREVGAVYPLPPSAVSDQIAAVCAFYRIGAAKTGMLWSAEIIEVVADALARHAPDVPLVVDPVMVATSGGRLLEDAAVRALTQRLLHRACLDTPNLAEAAILAEVDRIASETEMAAAARAIARRFGVPTLVKGGHLSGDPVDVFWDGSGLHRFGGRRVRAATHGTGCTLSAAITAGLARGVALKESIASAKEHVTRLLAGLADSGR